MQENAVFGGKRHFKRKQRSAPCNILRSQRSNQQLQRIRRGIKDSARIKRRLWAGAIFSKRLKRNFRPLCVCWTQTGGVIVFGGARQYREEELVLHYGRKLLLQVFITSLKKRNAVTACVKKHRRRKQYFYTRRVHRRFFDTRTFCSPSLELRFLQEYPQPEDCGYSCACGNCAVSFKQRSPPSAHFLSALRVGCSKKIPFPRFCYFFANATSITSSARFTGIN